jgi:hypothetical protein
VLSEWFKSGAARPARRGLQGRYETGRRLCKVRKRGPRDHPSTILPVDRWAALDASKLRLLAVFANAGVERVEYVVGFNAPYRVSVWLGTALDAEKAALEHRTDLTTAVAEALDAAGLSQTDAAFDGAVVVQSQETVDRDFAGSWFYALR